MNAVEAAKARADWSINQWQLLEQFAEVSSNTVDKLTMCFVKGAEDEASNVELLRSAFSRMNGQAL